MKREWKYSKQGSVHQFFDEGEPMVVYIIKLGTEDGYGYGVIVDDPWGGSMEPSRMSIEHIKEKFDIDISMRS